MYKGESCVVVVCPEFLSEDAVQFELVLDTLPTIATVDEGTDPVVLERVRESNVVLLANGFECIECHGLKMNVWK
jgi:hypothetical protein